MIFRIFKMAATAILDFCNLKILLVTGVERVETHQRAKFSENVILPTITDDYASAH